MPIVNLILFGASGRMGKAMLESIKLDKDVNLAYAIVKKENELYQKPLLYNDGVYVAASEVTNTPKQTVVVDFSLADSLKDSLSLALRLSLPIIIASTGHSDDNLKDITLAAEKIPVLFAPNTSIMLNTMALLIQKASEMLPKAEVAITELHHKHKKDSPSGTSLMLADKLAPKKVSISSMRAGLVNCEHTVFFFNDFERLEISHRAFDRKVFAQGALMAAKFIFAQAPGLYDMSHVLNIK